MIISGIISSPYVALKKAKRTFHYRPLPLLGTTQFLNVENSLFLKLESLKISLYIKEILYCPVRDTKNWIVRQFIFAQELNLFILQTNIK